MRVCAHARLRVLGFLPNGMPLSTPPPPPLRLPLFLGAQLKVKQLTGVEGIDEVSRAAEGIRDVQDKIDRLRASQPQH